MPKKGNKGRKWRRLDRMSLAERAALQCRNPKSTPRGRMAFAMATSRR